MRVATRLALGSGVLLAVLVGALSYNLMMVSSMASANRELVAVTFRASRLSRELGERLPVLDEYVRKLYVTNDPAYADKVVEARDAVTARLGELSNLALSATEEQTRSYLLALWNRFPLASANAAAIAAQPKAGDHERVLESLTGAIDTLSKAARAANSVSQDTIAIHVEEAALASQEAQRVALTVMGVALVLSIGIVVLTVRSIHTPLQRLTEGTRAVASGQFGYRLDTTGPVELASLAEDFNSMIERLGEGERFKRDFLSHVSHELRTPLVAMQETNQLLLEQAPGPLNERQHRLLDLNLQGAKRLSTMIANLLDLSRIEAGVMEYHVERQDLGRLVAGAVGQLESWAAQRGVRLVLREPAGAIAADCDGDRLVQVVVNLIDNAVKFSPEGKEVTVEIEVANRAQVRVPARFRRVLVAAAADTHFAQIRVSDRGHGVPDREKEAIFARFHQVATKGRKSRGVGLGLAICRQITEAHRGTLWVADNPGGGSVFTLLLPLPAKTDQELS